MTGAREPTDLVLLSLPIKVIDRPALCTPVLTAHLRAAGLKVVQGDQSMVIQDRLLTAEMLGHLRSTILPVIIRLNLGSTGLYQRLRTLYRRLLEIDHELGLDRIEQVKLSLQRREYDQLCDPLAVRAMSAIFELSDHLRHYMAVPIYYHELLDAAGADEPVARAIDSIIQEIVETAPRAVGLSIFDRQRELSLWFGERLRRRYSGLIVVGGSDPSLNQETYLVENAFVDAVVVGSGEQALSELLTRLRAGSTALDQIDNLIWRDHGAPRANQIRSTPIDEMCVPDYDGLPMSLYLTDTLQVVTSKGCPWSRCSFCMHWRSYGARFSQRPVARVVDEIESLHRRWGTRYFAIVDETIDPGYGTDLADEIAARELDIRWINMSRLDPGFDQEVFERWYRGGCRVIEWGLESGSQQVLDDMRKGVDIAVAQRLIHQAAAAGIVSKMLMFHGYPTERIEDLWQSIEIIRRNARLGLIKPMLTLRHGFVLKMGSPLAEIGHGSTEESQGSFSRYFHKTWLPDSAYNVNAQYVPARRDTEVKRRLIGSYLNEIEAELSSRKAFITNNANITMDLVLIDLVEQGKAVPVDLMLPRRRGGLRHAQSPPPRAPRPGAEA